MYMKTNQIKAYQAPECVTIGVLVESAILTSSSTGFSTEEVGDEFNLFDVE